MPEDAVALTAIYNEYILHTTITFEVEPLTVEQMRERILALSASFPYFVYEEDGKVQGYCYAHAWKERAAYRNTWETTIYVDASAPRRGIGTALMKRLMEVCRERGVHVLIACITHPNEPSVALHERLGFVKVAHFKQVGRKFDKWLDVCDYQLILP